MASKLEKHNVTGGNMRLSKQPQALLPGSTIADLRRALAMAPEGSGRVAGVGKGSRRIEMPAAPPETRARTIYAFYYYVIFEIFDCVNEIQTYQPTRPTNTG